MSQPAPILEPDLALALWRWGWEVLRGPRPRDRPRGVVVAGLVDVLALAACELSLAGRTEWVDDLPELLSIVRGFFLHPDSPRAKCLQSLSDLLAKGAPVTANVEAMARSTLPVVRAALARGLRPASSIHWTTTSSPMASRTSLQVRDPARPSASCTAFSMKAFVRSSPARRSTASPMRAAAERCSARRLSSSSSAASVAACAASS